MSTATAIDRGHCGLPVFVQIGSDALVQAGAPDPIQFLAAQTWRIVAFSAAGPNVAFQAAGVMAAVLKGCDLLIVA